VLLDESPTASPAVPDNWRPAREPSSADLAAAALLRLAVNPVAQLLLLTDAVRHPSRSTAQIWNVLRGLGTLSRAVPSAAASSLSGSISAHRRFAWVTVPVADIKKARAALGGTFNDIVLTAITAGFHDLLLARGETPSAHSVRTLVPVNVRAPGEESIRDNRVSLMLADLPVDITDPKDRLAEVRRRLDDLKSSKEAESAAALTVLARREPFPLLSLPYRLAARLPQRSVVTVTTNVPGPRHPLYALGRRLIRIIPYVPIASTVRVGVSVLSYCDEVSFGITGDYDSSPDVAVLSDSIKRRLAELVRLTRSGKRPAGHAAGAARPASAPGPSGQAVISSATTSGTSDIGT
jgi:diacylglycerol O-acyltransferase